MKRTFILILIVVMLFLSGCSMTGLSLPNNNPTNTQPTNCTIEYSSTEQIFNAPDGSGFVIARYSCALPHVSMADTLISEKINAKILDFEEKFYVGSSEEGGSVGIDQLYEMAIDCYCSYGNSMQPLLLSREVSVTSQNEKYIVLHYTDTFATETGTSKVTETSLAFDLKTGERINNPWMIGIIG